MAYITPIPITHSTVAGNVPNTDPESAIGALSVNVTDGAIYTRDYVGRVIRIEGDTGNDAIASAATLDLGSVMAGVVDVTGTTTITAIALRVGQTRTVRFTGVLTLTHGANLVLPGAASITTAAGDFATFRGYTGGVVRCTYYSAASIAAQIHAATSKATPVDADELGLADSAATFGLKMFTWANLKAAIKSWLSGESFPIGIVTPAAGGFTALNVSGNISLPNNTYLYSHTGESVAYVKAGFFLDGANNKIYVYANNAISALFGPDGLAVTGALSATGPISVGSYTLATRPPHSAGVLIYVSDAAAGANFQGSNGSAWVNLG